MLRHYTAPFAKLHERKGTLAFAKSLLNDQVWFGSLWEKVAVLQEKPILFLWGMNDNFVTPNYLETFAAAFLHKKIVKLENCGHFPQEERKTEVLQEIQHFLS